MTYREIISHVARQLGHQGFSNELKADYRYAVKWAENEMMTEIEQVKDTTEIVLLDTTIQYNLPVTFGEPTGVVVLDSSNNQLSYEMVTYEEWLKWNPTAPTGTENDILEEEDNQPSYDTLSARLSNKMVIAIQRESTNIHLFVKPAINGTFQIVHTLIPVQDIFGTVGDPPVNIIDTSPILPVQYHHFMIFGAVFYLAQVELGKAVTNKDYNASQFYKNIKESAFTQFEARKIKMSAHQDLDVGPTIMKADNWYERGRKYR